MRLRIPELLSRGRSWRAAAAAAGVLASGVAMTAVAVAGPHASIGITADDSGNGQRIASIATSHLGRPMGTSDNPDGNPPSWYEWWCADFAKYVWGQAGADTSGLNAAASSFLSYAGDNPSPTPQVGDVMLVGTMGTDPTEASITHVAIVTSINGSNVTTVGGDEGTGMWYQNSVRQQTTGSSQGSYFGTGYVDGSVVQVYVAGYVAPNLPSGSSSD